MDDEMREILSMTMGDYNPMAKNGSAPHPNGNGHVGADVSLEPTAEAQQAQPSVLTANPADTIDVVAPPTDPNVLTQQITLSPDGRTTVEKVGELSIFHTLVGARDAVRVSLAEAMTGYIDTPEGEQLADLPGVSAIVRCYAPLEAGLPSATSFTHPAVMGDIAAQKLVPTRTLFLSSAILLKDHALVAASQDPEVDLDTMPVRTFLRRPLILDQEFLTTLKGVAVVLPPPRDPANDVSASLVYDQKYDVLDVGPLYHNEQEAHTNGHILLGWVTAYPDGNYEIAGLHKHLPGTDDQHPHNPGISVMTNVQPEQLDRSSLSSLVGTPPLANRLTAVDPSTVDPSAAPTGQGQEGLLTVVNPADGSEVVLTSNFTSVTRRMAGAHHEVDPRAFAPATKQRSLFGWIGRGQQTKDPRVLVYGNNEHTIFDGSP